MNPRDAHSRMNTAFVVEKSAPGLGPPRGDADARLRERALIVAVQTGDEGAFAALVRLHQRRAAGVGRAPGASGIGEIDGL